MPVSVMDCSYRGAAAEVEQGQLPLVEDRAFLYSPAAVIKNLGTG